MSARQYLLVSGTVFALVALAHILRIAGGMAVMIETWPLPMWVSILGTIVPAFLAYSAFRLAVRTG